MTSETLLPCPFCNGEYVRKELSPHTSKPVLEQLAEDSGGGWRVCCYGCHVQTWNGLSKEEAIKTWNRRLSTQKAATVLREVSKELNDKCPNCGAKLLGCPQGEYCSNSACGYAY